MSQMWRLMVFASLAVVFVTTLGVSSEPKCMIMLHNLSTTEREFVTCLNDKSVNITICTGCLLQYDNTVESFKQLKNSCSTEFFNKDRINILETIEESLTGLWDRAYCQDCQDNNWAEFNKLKEQFDFCIKHNDDVCDACLSNYVDLNDFYMDMDAKKHGAICYDRQDYMNRTRFNWSHTSKCCKREFDGRLFILASSLITSLPLLFYGGLYAYGKYRERNPGLLEIETPHSSSRRLARPARPQISAVPPAGDAPGSSTLAAHAPTADDEDDDDEDAPPEKPSGKKIQLDDSDTDESIA